MKTRIYLKVLLASALTFVCLTTFDSCKKDNKETSIDEVIKVAPAATVKTELSSATTLDALPAEVKTAATTITNIITDTKAASVASVDLNQVILNYQNSIKLSADEVTKLKNNDEYTYSSVVARMVALPSFLSETELSSSYTAMQSVAALNSRLIPDPGTVEDLYAVNLYQGVLDLQNYINTYTIPALQQLATLKANALKSASTVADTQAMTLIFQRYYTTYIFIIFNNFYIIRITYNRPLVIKHNGGSIG